MALWSNTDANTSAPKYAAAGGLGVAANGFTLYANTTANAFVQNLTVGVFGVDAEEAKLAPPVSHAGWVLRTVGQGGRAGRVFNETLVAMGSMTGDGSDDAVYVDRLITITSQPQSVSIASGNNTTITVGASVSPTSALSYQWYNANGNVLLSGNTAPSLNLFSVTANAEYYVVVSATGASNVTSTNSVITIV